MIRIWNQGPELDQTMKALHPEVPIVMLSGCAVLSNLELLWVDAHFGWSTSLDDLLLTLLLYSRRVVREPSNRIKPPRPNGLTQPDEVRRKTSAPDWGSRRVKQQGGRTRDREADDHLKTPSGPILSFDFTTMKSHSPLRDRQTQADTAGGTFS